MALRANWKGVLQIAELACPVALYTAASTSDRIAFHTINRATGNRVQRQFVDAETGKLVELDDQVKGYELSGGDHILLDPEEIAATVPDSDKTLKVETFLDCAEVDDVYFDKPYYLTPSSPSGAETFVLIREGLQATRTVAIARTVLFRRMRTLLIRSSDSGLVASTLNFDYEVRPAAEMFQDIPALKIKGEMLDLAKHIIETKTGKFDPADFDDRYDAALEELIRAKIEGRKPTSRPAEKRETVVDLMAALRESAKRAAKKPATKKLARKTASSGRKAG